MMTFMILLMMKILQKKETEQPCCLDRPFKLCVFHIKTEDKWLKKVAKPVKITSFTSNTITLYRTNAVQSQDGNTPICDVPQSMVHNVEVNWRWAHSSPPSEELFKRFYPNTQEVSPQIMFNFLLKCKDLQCKYGSVNNVLSDQVDAAFNPSSLENAPEHWGNNHKYPQVSKEAIQEILLGPWWSDCSS